MTARSTALELFTACELGDARRVSIHLERGAPVNAKIDGFTPLQAAAREGHADVLQVLIAAGADIDATHAEGWSPVMLAVSAGCLQSVGVLLAAGADPDIALIEGWTPLNEAVDKRHLEILKLLLAAGARVLSHDPNWISPLQQACKRDYMAAAEAIARSLTPEQINMCTLEACRTGNESMFDLMVAHGADPFYRFQNRSLLQWTINNDDMKRRVRTFQYCGRSRPQKPAVQQESVPMPA